MDTWPQANVEVLTVLQCSVDTLMEECKGNGAQSPVPVAHLLTATASTDDVLRADAHGEEGGDLNNTVALLLAGSEKHPADEPEAGRRVQGFVRQMYHGIETCTGGEELLRRVELSLTQSLLARRPDSRWVSHMYYLMTIVGKGARCHRCARAFRDEDKLVEHRETAHSPQGDTAYLATVVFPRKTGFGRRMQQCIICGYAERGWTVRHVLRHIMQRHQEVRRRFGFAFDVGLLPDQRSQENESDSDKEMQVSDDDYATGSQARKFLR